MSQSFLQKYGPAAIARGLWGNGPIPIRYKILFIGQGLIFTTALWIRSQDVEKAKKIKKLMDAEKLRSEIRGESGEKP
ncbi:hypothetical protein ACHAXA_007597 [Cyclostephanos tholiformis]|jgi:hypothetical protein|uniref:Uncharacterized protein n=1 Tax=Cyclostephanos tholiformis TaxID=382380 RepID=A0ABD3REH1_9STRA